MPKQIDQILFEIKELKSWLYGADGHTGDIVEIKDSVKNHNRRIRRIELILAGLAGTGALGGGVAGIIKLLSG